jgi:thioredoxin 1
LEEHGMTANQPLTLTDANFEAEVTKSELPVLVDFWAAWCGPCRMVAPIVDALAEQYAGKAKIMKLNVDDNPEISRRFNIRSIPTLIVFKGGVAKETAIGLRPKPALEQLLNQYV